MTETVSASKIAELMEDWAPAELAYSWDNVGLQVGSLEKEVSKILITLDVIESVVDEAIENGAEMIIAHHPLLFRPLKQIDFTTSRGRIIEKLVKHGITVYAAHTNLDMADGGVSDMLAELIGIESSQVLVDEKNEQLYKLVVFVPETHAEDLRKALGDAGAGAIGNYSHCSFQSKGEGSFIPQDGSNPYLGKAKQLERVQEVKIEMIIKQTDIEKLVRLVYTTHPYEEPAFDIFPLANQGIAVGPGRIGDLGNELTIKELCQLIKEKWGIPYVRVSGNMDEKVRKVALLGGSGEDFIPEAVAKQADVYITGDLTFHHAQDAWQSGMNLIDAGHYAEKVMKKFVKQYLDEHLDKEKGIEVLVSTESSDPFKLV